MPWTIIVIIVSLFANWWGLLLLPLADWVSYLLCALIAALGVPILALGVKTLGVKAALGKESCTLTCIGGCECRRSVLVTKGNNSYIRNPICLSCVLLAFGAAFGFKSGVGLIVAILALLLAYMRIMLMEQKELHNRFGAEYSEYKSRVGLFIPRFTSILGKHDEN